MTIQLYYEPQMVKEVPIGGSVIWNCPDCVYAKWSHKSLSKHATFSDLYWMKAKVYQRNYAYSSLELTSVTEKHRGFYKCLDSGNEYIFYLEVLGNNGSHNNISAY